jgi:putative flippase GtrA
LHLNAVIEKLDLQTEIRMDPDGVKPFIWQGWLRRLWSSQFFRFLVVGAGNTLFSYGVYTVCVLIGIPYQAAVVVSAVISIIFNFFTTGTIVFSNAAIGKIFGFLAAYGVALAANLVLLTMLVDAGVSKLIGQAMVLPAIVVMSFLLNKFLVFRGTA